MSSRITHVAIAALLLISTAACDDSGDSGSSGDTSSSQAPKVSIAAAMKSDAAATSACRALVGDGAKQADWLTDVISTGTSVEGEPTMHGFKCVVTDVNHQYAGFDFVQTQERLDYEVKDALRSTSTPEDVASAWNAETQAGVYSESVSEGKSQTATQDMQTIVNQVGQ